VERVVCEKSEEVLMAKARYFYRAHGFLAEVLSLRGVEA